MENTKGRPTDYTTELGEKLCAELAQGKSLRTVCNMDGMPDKSTVFRWFRVHTDFCDQYARAKEESAEAMHEELADLAEEAIIDSKKVGEKRANAVVSAYKLKADNLKWAMSKMKPKKYGDKLDMMSGGEPIKGNIIEFVNFKKPDDNDKAKD